MSGWWHGGLGRFELQLGSGEQDGGYLGFSLPRRKRTGADLFPHHTTDTSTVQAIPPDPRGLSNSL